MKNFMLVDNWNDVKEKIIKGSVNIVRPPRELEGVIDELALTLAPSSQCAWALVHDLDLHLERGKDLNGTMMQVVVWQGDRLLLQEFGGSQVLVSSRCGHAKTVVVERAPRQAR